MTVVKFMDEQKDLRVEVGRAGFGLALVYARTVPPRSLRQAHQLRFGKVIAADDSASTRGSSTPARGSAARPVPLARLSRMARAVIVSAVRTPFGKLGGGLKGHEVPELGAVAIRAALDRV